MSDDKKEPELYLSMFLYHKKVNEPATIIRFKQDAWEMAIAEAYSFSLRPERIGITRITVMDAWGFEIVRFTPRWMYAKDHG